MVAGPALLVYVGIGLVILGVPVAVLIAASRGGQNLGRIVRPTIKVMIVAVSLWTVIMIAALASPTVTVTVPVETVPVHIPDGVTIDGAPASIQSGGFDRVTASVTGLPVATRVVMGASWVLAAAAAIVVALVVLKLVRSIGDGDPFALGSRALVVTAWVVLIGGTASIWIGNVGDWLASQALFGTGSWGGTVPEGVTSLTELGWPEAAFLSLDLPWAPFAIAMVLALLAGVFRYGAALRRDAEGLV